MEKNEVQNTKTIIENCLANAEACLSVAERELDKDVDHVCFHLALLSLEEIGKAILITINFTLLTAQKEKPGIETAFNEHKKKIFWALWGGSLLGKRLSAKDIREMQSLSSTLHDRRLLYLYTDPNNLLDPKNKIEEGEAKRLVEFVRAKLEIEKLNQRTFEFTPEEIKELKWFYNTVEDPEKRKQIFSRHSIEKFEEFGNGKSWIHWLYESEKKIREEMMLYTQQEISRPQPPDSEKMNPKYKLRFRIHSASHTIRDNAFDEWNKNVNDIKIIKSTKKNNPVWAKSEITIEVIFFKGTSPASLWDAGFSMAKTVVNALNIGTMGLFWWNMPKDVEKYYDQIIDIEADPKGSIMLNVLPEKRLMIDWGDYKSWTLKRENMGEVSLILGFLFRQYPGLNDFMASYALGLTFLAKTDVHLRLELNAFDEFFTALKKAMIKFGDWDEKSNFIEVAKMIFSDLNLESLESTLKLAAGIDRTGSKPHNITLTEVIGMKLYCDAYIKIKAQEFYDKESSKKLDPK